MRDPVRTMRIDGVKTPVTPVPDDAELAAQALLESMNNNRETIINKAGAKEIVNGKLSNSKCHDAAYYKQLSEKIRKAHEQERRAAMRYVAYVEQELARVNGERLTVNGSDNHEPCTMSHEPESIATLEQGLYKWQDVVEREGGELLKRWQKCLAECIVRQMNAPIEREESDVRIDSPEREEGQTKFNTADDTDENKE